MHPLSVYTYINHESCDVLNTISFNDFFEFAGFKRTLDSSSADIHHDFNENAQMGNFPTLTVKLFRLTEIVFF